MRNSVMLLGVLPETGVIATPLTVTGAVGFAGRVWDSPLT